MKKYATGDKLKKINLSDIYAYILEKKQTTRREIEYDTGFSWGTVSANVAYLIEKGYVYEEKKDSGGAVGRTTYLLRPCGEGVAGIGLDINRSGLSCVIVSPDSEIKARFTTAFTAKCFSEVLNRAEELFLTAADWCEKNGYRVFSLGIAIQGTVDGKSGFSLSFPHIPDWKPFDVKGYFAGKYGIPVYLGHDPVCMLSGVLRRERVDDCVLIRIDGGIGMAVSVDGKIIDGTGRFELGHTVAVQGGRECSCGKRGCLEAYCSLSGIARAVNASHDDVLMEREKFEKELCGAGEMLSLAIGNVLTLFAPRRLILTGVASDIERLISDTVSMAEGRGVGVTVDSGISAAYGAAVEGIFFGVKELNL